MPPKLAPTQIIILPIYKNEEQKNQVLKYCSELKITLDEQIYSQKPLRVTIDDRPINAGEKTWDAIKKGIPVRLEVGPRDIAENAVFLGRRDLSPKKKESVDRDEFITNATKLLDEIQKHLYDKAYLFKQSHSIDVKTQEEFEQFFKQSNNNKGGFVRCFSSYGPKVDAIIKPLKVTARCIPLKTKDERGKCIFTGQEGVQKIIFAKAY